ncbi:MAG TPA: N-acetylmuramoyl-L-alanine amidase [Longimicrobiales bacterium]|nr:N-acetylmuramoyl-L-alanine amidase [Longimicrobiales bacterium]
MLVFLIIIALLQPAALWAQAASLGIDGGAGVQMVEVERARGEVVFSLAALRPLGAKIDNDARSVHLTLFDDVITFDIGSPFFRRGSEVFQLASPTHRNTRTSLVATQFLTEWLPSHYADRLTFKDGILRAKRNPPPVATRPAPTPGSVPAPTPSPGSVPRVVILDAGHGGRDAGKVGPNGLAEKNVTLTLTTKVAALLRDRGYEVHMTRAADTLIALADRPRFANQWKNGRPSTLFVSIHANAGVSQAQGFETYFLSEARTADERRVAEMENAAVAFEEKSSATAPAIDQLLTGLRNDYYQRASNDLAEVVQRELGAFHPGTPRGVKQAGFRVLVGAVMPAILVEVAFISNPNEARLLGTAAFQDKISYSLARSIANFFDTHEHLWQSEPAQ